MSQVIRAEGSVKVPLYFRVNSNGLPLDFTFRNEDGSAYSFIYDDFQLILKKNIGDKKNVKVLGFGSGLTLTNNVLRVQFTQATSKVQPGEYFWMLYKNDFGRPWFTGPAYAIEGDMPTIEALDPLTIVEGGQNIIVTIQESTPTVIQDGGETYTAGNGLTLSGTEFQLGGELDPGVTTIDLPDASILTVQGQTANTVINLDAGMTNVFGNGFTIGTSEFYIDPVELNQQAQDYILYYDLASGKVSYEAVPEGGGGAVESVTGDGVDNTDPENPVIDLSDYYTSTQVDNEITDAKAEVITYTFRDETDSTTLTLTDFQTPSFLRITKTGTATVTVPTNASVAVAIGRAIIVKKVGTGDLTFDPAVGVTIVPSNGEYTSIPNQQVVLLKEGTNTWGLYNGVAIDTDALGLVPDTRQIAGINLEDDITATELKNALQVPVRTFPSGADINNATTSFADVTGYSFAVTAGVKYYFKMRIPYIASGSTEGSRWAINGPAVTYLQYDITFNLTQSGRAFHLSMDAYDEPATASATTNIATGGDNTCIIEGVINPSADGTVIARFAAENGGAASITAKRNGYNGWVEVTIIG